MVKPLGAKRHQVYQFTAVEQFRGVRRHGPCRHDEQPRDAQRLGNLCRISVPGEIIGQACFVGTTEQFVQRWIAQVSVNQQHLAAGLAQINGNIDRSGGFTLMRADAGELHCLGGALCGREREGCAHGPIRLRQSRRGLFVGHECYFFGA